MTEAQTPLSHYRQVKNPTPVFTPQEGESTSLFCLKLLAKADGFSFGFDFAVYVAFACAAGKRRRLPPVLRRRAIDALLQGMLFYYDPVTNSVRRSVFDLAKDCGLTTISPNGSVSAGKATKALKFLDEILGFIVYTPGSYPSVSFTPVLFEAFNLFPQTLAEARLAGEGAGCIQGECP